MNLVKYVEICLKLIKIHSRPLTGAKKAIKLEPEGILAGVR